MALRAESENAREPFIFSNNESCLPSLFERRRAGITPPVEAGVRRRCADYICIYVVLIVIV